MSNDPAVSEAADINSNGDADDESMAVDQTVDDMKTPDDEDDGADQLEDIPGSEPGHNQPDNGHGHGSDSEFDELESIADGQENSSSLINPASRRATLQEKRLKREAEAAERARAREARLADKAENALKRRIKMNEDEFQKLSKRGEELEREFRKYRDVARIRPLGKDRFFNRYFYFDGLVYSLSLIFLCWCGCF